MTKTFYFCPEYYRSAYEFGCALHELLKQMAFGVSDAFITRITISNRLPVVACCGDSEMVFSVEYGVDKPEKIELAGNYRALDDVSRYTIRAFAKYAVADLEVMQANRPHGASTKLIASMPS